MKLIVTIPNALFISLIAFAVAIGASFMLKRGIVSIITGHTHPREHGIILTISSLCLLALSIATIIGSEKIVVFLTKHLPLVATALTTAP